MDIYSVEKNLSGSVLTAAHSNASFTSKPRQARLLLINAVVVITSIVGILSILEVARGVGFHESNIQHLGLTSELQEKDNETGRAFGRRYR